MARNLKFVVRLEPEERQQSTSETKCLEDLLLYQQQRNAAATRSRKKRPRKLSVCPISPSPRSNGERGDLDS